MSHPMTDSERERYGRIQLDQYLALREMDVNAVDRRIRAANGRDVILIPRAEQMERHARQLVLNVAASLERKLNQLIALDPPDRKSLVRAKSSLADIVSQVTDA